MRKQIYLAFVMTFITICESRGESLFITDPTHGTSKEELKCVRPLAKGVMFSAWFIGDIDPTLEQNVNNARLFGFPILDIYIALTPAYPGAASIQQMLLKMNATFKALHVQPRRLWFGIRDVDNSWFVTKKANFEYLVDLTITASAYGWTVGGFFSVVNEWNKIVGDNWSNHFETFGAWYIGSNEYTLDDWQNFKFGRWPVGKMKSISGQQGMCTEFPILVWSDPDEDFKAN